ncbi:MAG: apolipoprotein N-acyltransferase [Planctomycetes bacterium]|nr:apolipoprotein N-acyltransferase [Planctomycetota bacterium]
MRVSLESLKNSPPLALGLSIAGGALLAISFHPFDLGFLSFVALVPWSLLVALHGDPHKTKPHTFLKSRATTVILLALLLLPTCAIPFGLAVLFFRDEWFDPARKKWQFFVFALLPMVLFVVLAARSVFVNKGMRVTLWLGILLFSAIAQNFLMHVDPYFASYIFAQIALPLFLITPMLWTKQLYDKLRLPMFIALPVAWVAMEFFREIFPLSFPWFFLSAAQHDSPPMLQMMDLVGAYGLSFVVAMINGIVVDAILFLRAREYANLRTKRSLVKAAAVPAVVLVAAISYGVYRLDTIKLESGPKVLLVQANIEQDIKLDSTFESDAAQFAKHLYYGRLAVRENPGADLVLFAETIIPSGYGDDPHYQKEMSLFAKYSRASVVFGALTTNYREAGGKPGIANTLLQLSEDGEIAGRYDKLKLVLGSEYTPLEGLMPWFKKGLLLVSGLYAGMHAGEEVKVLTVETSEGKILEFGPMVCYDSVYSFIARQQAALGADFFVVISNDAWFRESSELDEISDATMFRAVETRKGIARCTNSGISSIISPLGEIDKLLVETPEGVKDRTIEGFKYGTVMFEQGETIFVRFGWLFHYLNLVLLAALLIYSHVRKRRIEQRS